MEHIRASLSFRISHLTTMASGFPFSYGVFQAYYATHPLFADNKNGLAAVGTSATGIMYLRFTFILSSPLFLHTNHISSSIFVFYILQRFPPPTNHPISLIGPALLVTSLITSSFSHTVDHLIVTHG